MCGSSLLRVLLLIFGEFSFLHCVCADDPMICGLSLCRSLMILTQRITALSLSMYDGKTFWVIPNRLCNNQTLLAVKEWLRLYLDQKFVLNL